MSLKVFLNGIANAIKNKKGTTEPINAQNFASEIESIETGDDSALIGLIERTATHMDIPQYIEKIGAYAFRYFTSLVDINIPESVTSIGEYSFANCTALQSVTIPDSVISFGRSVFEGCSSLKSVTVPDHLQLFYGQYYNCGNLTDVKITTATTQIYNNTFVNCSSIKTLHFHNKLTIISAAFTGCSALEFVTLEDGFKANGLNLSASTKFNADTLVNMLTTLADRTGEAAYTLTLGATNLAKLTAEQIKIATDKNWMLA